MCLHTEHVLGKESRKSEEDQNGSNTDQKEGSKQRSKKGMQPLCRPIIAVCNDIYAPALRPLRAVAKVIQFKKPSVSSCFTGLLSPTLMLQMIRLCCSAMGPCVFVRVSNASLKCLLPGKLFGSSDEHVQHCGMCCCSSAYRP